MGLSCSVTRYTMFRQEKVKLDSVYTMLYVLAIGTLHAIKGCTVYTYRNKDLNFSNISQ